MNKPTIFFIYSYNNKYKPNHTSDYMASVVFDRDNVQAEDIIKLVDKVYEINLSLKNNAL